jgi:hypothetical protein
VLMCMSQSNRTRNLIMFRCGCIAGVDVHIILPFLHLSHPRLKLILFSQIWLPIYNINCGSNRKIYRQSSLYAFSLIFSRTLNRPLALGINLDFLKSENRSFHKCNLTKSPGSKSNCFLPPSPLILYLVFMRSMFF